MEIGRDWDAEWKNQWPLEKEAPLFKKSMLEFYEVGFIISCKGDMRLILFYVTIDVSSPSHRRYAVNRDWP